MAKKFWQIANGGADLEVTADPITFNVAQLQVNLPQLQEIQGLSDELRSVIAAQGLTSLGIPAQQSLEAFDDLVTDEVERILDLVDYPTYQTKQETLGNVADGAWWEPEAVDVVSAQEIGAAALAIDGQNSTGWRTAMLPASITFRLRSYRKNVEKIRLWVPNNTPPTELQGLTVRGAQALAMIDEPQNVLVASANLSFDGTAWHEVPFDGGARKRLRYIKLDVAGSNHVSDVMIRGIEARVTTFQHLK